MDDRDRQGTGALRELRDPNKYTEVIKTDLAPLFARVALALLVLYSLCFSPSSLLLILNFPLLFWHVKDQLQLTKFLSDFKVQRTMKWQSKYRWNLFSVIFVLCLKDDSLMEELDDNHVRGVDHRRKYLTFLV